MTNIYDSGFDGNDDQLKQVGRVDFLPLHTTKIDLTATDSEQASIEQQFIRFAPIIVTSYSDNISVSTTKERVFGRTDPIMFYQGNERKAQMTFLTLQQDGGLAINQFSKLKELMRNQYPVYDNTFNTTLVAPPLFRVIFRPLGDQAAPLLDEIGFLDGMNFDYADPSSIINTPQIAETEAEGEDELIGVSVAPRYFQINFGLNIIHREVAGFSVDTGAQLNPRNLNFPFNF